PPASSPSPTAQLLSQLLPPPSPGPAFASPSPVIPRTLARATSTPRSAPARRTLARALPETPNVGGHGSAAAGAAQGAAGGAHSSSGGGAGPSSGGGGGGGGSAGGHSSDLIYGEMLRRVREEQEQLGQLINHPF
ncbi:MAG TPA: hypothetical protein VHV28_07870, partial [Solirubrobacteraceae bacterium]|nr:hypothetical protein [Solirubrobacteraceae bacterium]